MLVAFPLALAIQLFRFSTEVNWANVALWVFVVDVVLVALASLVILLQAKHARSTA